MKKVKYLLVALLTMLFTTNVYADHMYNVTMDINLDEYGNAKITEVWDVQADSGSEWYKALYNMGNERITNYKVSMDGRELTQKSWDVDESMSEKAGFYGINYVAEGLELCFGKSDYNRHRFTLTYELSNMIINVDGNQVLYQTLLPNVTLDKFSVVVRSYYEFPKTLDVWGYGYKGYAYVENGLIKMSNEENTGLYNDYVVLLAKFPAETFKTSNYSDDYHTFDDIFGKAEEGTYEYDYGTKMTTRDKILAIISFFTSFFVPVILIIVSVSAFSNYTRYGTKKIAFKKGTKKVKDAPYFREIPYKDIFKAYWVACQYGLVKKETDFLGAILLKWLKNGNIENTTVEVGLLKKKEERAVKLISPKDLSERELEIYNMMQRASEDGVLESNEFKKWCKTHYQKVLNWFTNVIDDETINFANEKYLTPEKKTFSTVYNADEKMYEKALQVSGLKNFLNEFSNIKERESIEVKLWEEYLMYAQIFGIAEKVAKEFKKLYPDVITDDTYNDVIFIHNISYSGVQAASSARAAAESYSSGGGGFSSGGGGGGSFGGGGSMGGR